jgi:hypothetical protein
MNSYILDSLNYFYNLNKINPNDIKFSNEYHNLMPVVYIKESKKVFNIIGIFDCEKEIFHWAWATSFKKHNYIKTNQLILHGINIDTNTIQDIYLKKILTSSFIKIDNSAHLNIILSISCYLTKTNGLLTISANNDLESNYVTYYGYYDIE